VSEEEGLLRLRELFNAGFGGDSAGGGGGGGSDGDPALSPPPAGTAVAEGGGSPSKRSLEAMDDSASLSFPQTRG
jgi:hypothetical protein